MAIIHYTGYCPVCKKYQTKEKICTKCEGTLRRCSKWVETYRVIENDKVVQKKSRMFNTKREIEEVSAIRRLQQESKPISYLTFNDLSTAYLDRLDKNAKESSYVCAESHIRTRLTSYLAENKLDEITVKDLQEVKNSLNEYSDNYKYKLWCLLGSLFKFADRALDCPAPLKVFRIIQPFKRPHSKRDYWNLDTWKTFIAKVEECMNLAKNKAERDEHYLFYVFFNTLYYDGNRHGEATASKVNCFYLDDATPYCEVKETVSYKVKKEKRKKGITYNVTPTKTNTARNIKIPKNLCSLLKEYIAYFGLKGDDFLFFKNRPIPQQTIRRRFDYYIDLAGVKRITPHQLRNSIASLIFSKGENTIAAAYATANRLGHSVKFALDTYGNLFSDEEDKIIEKIDSC